MNLLKVPENEVLDKPLIYCHFAKGIGEPKYMPIQTWQGLNKILTDALHSYNELNAAMDLVLFEDAMSHICKINRILESPRGNALLVGMYDHVLKFSILFNSLFRKSDTRFLLHFKTDSVLKKGNLIPESYCF